MEKKLLSFCAAWHRLLCGEAVAANDVADGFGRFLRVMERAFGNRAVCSKVGDRQFYSLT